MLWWGIGESARDGVLAREGEEGIGMGGKEEMARR